MNGTNPEIVDQLAILSQTTVFVGTQGSAFFRFLFISSLVLLVSVIVSGLDMDSFCQPFDVVATLLAKADTVEKLTAVCMKWGRRFSSLPGRNK